jgi:hypothetical protein
MKKYGFSPVYLGGPIHGLSDDECRGWRDLATDRLNAAGLEVINPILWDFRGKEDFYAPSIVKMDLGHIHRAGALLVNASKPGWGTAMEIRVGYEWHKAICAFTEAP